MGILFLLWHKHWETWTVALSVESIKNHDTYVIENGKTIEWIEEMGIPFAYDHFAEGESPDPPFICYLLPDDENFAADGKVYYRISGVRIELYTDFKDPILEQKVTAVLDSHGIFYARNEVWIEDEKLYEVAFEFAMPV